MSDDAEILAEAPPARWPLHPAPYALEGLEAYVRRLAGAYGIGLEAFCKHGLGCELGDLDRCADDPPEALLRRLSAGTGQPMRRLRAMTHARRHARMRAALAWMVRRDPEIVQKWAPKVPGHREFVDGI